MGSAISFLNWRFYCPVNVMITKQIQGAPSLNALLGKAHGSPCPGEPRATFHESTQAADLRYQAMSTAR